MTSQVKALKEAISNLIDRVETIETRVGATKVDLEEVAGLLQLVGATSSNDNVSEMISTLVAMERVVDEVVELAEAFRTSGQQYVAGL